MDKQKMIALGVAGALVYVSTSGMVKNKALQTALLAVGAVSIAKQIPVANQYVG